MGKKIQILICMGILTGLLFACAGNNDREEKEKIASGGGISGQAVVSGSGIHENAASEGKKKKYHFCNEYCLYYSEQYSNCIIEHRLSDGSERKIKMRDDIIICYVDDDWVYYLENRTSYDFQSDLYRAPVEEKKLNIEKAECMFTEKSGIDAEEVYCDGRYLVYITGEFMDSHYRKYDLREKKYVAGQKEGVEPVSLDGVAGGTVFYSGSEGTIRDNLDSGESVEVDAYFDPSSEGDGQLVMTDSDIFYAGDECFMMESGDPETYMQQYEDANGSLPIHIGQYHLADNSNKKIIDRYYMKSLLIQEGFIDASYTKEYKYYPERLFVSGNRLYVQMDINWLEKGVFYQNKAVFSYKIGKKEKLRYEKGLTECLANPKKDQKVFEKIFYDEDDEGEDAVFLSRGGCLYMAEGKCFMYLYDSRQGKNRVACYNLASGKLKFLTKKDSDWYLPYYNGAQLYWKRNIGNTEIMQDMPNNKDVDWPYW